MDPATPPLIDWSQVFEGSCDGRLLALLHTLPRARWAERDPLDSDTFLHFAARFGNMDAAVALLQSGLVGVNARNMSGYNSAHLVLDVAVLRQETWLLLEQRDKDIISTHAVVVRHLGVLV